MKKFTVATERFLERNDLKASKQDLIRIAQEERAKIEWGKVDIIAEYDTIINELNLI